MNRPIKNVPPQTGRAAIFFNPTPGNQVTQGPAPGGVWAPGGPRGPAGGAPTLHKNRSGASGGRAGPGGGPHAIFYQPTR